MHTQEILQDALKPEEQKKYERDHKAAREMEAATRAADKKRWLNLEATQDFLIWLRKEKDNLHSRILVSAHKDDNAQEVKTMVAQYAVLCSVIEKLESK